MSLSVKTQGGGGGFFPSIFVTGLSETDTVYAAKDGKTVRGKWDSERSGFLISPLREFGTWTVTATNGEKTKTQDVLVDVATEYEIEIDLYKLWLYREGDEYEEVTGGWFNNTGSIMWGYSASGGTVTFGESMYLYAASNKAAIATTNNKVLINGYSKIVAVFGSMTDADPRIMLTAEKTGTLTTNAVCWFNPNGANTTTEKSLDGLTGEYYFSFGLASDRHAYLKQLWLE